MMKEIVRFISEYPLSAFCVVLIWVLSLAPFFPETPLDNVRFIDKYTHCVMYGGTCAVVWFEHLRRCRKKARKPDLRTFGGSVLLCLVALGGLMELLQAYATTTRSGEWLDFWADSLGAVLGTLVGWLMWRLYFQRR